LQLAARLDVLTDNEDALDREKVLMRISEYECKLDREAPEIVMPEKVLDD